MSAFIIYELKVAVILAAFYLCFKCFLCKEKMHRMNRIVLVATSVLSFVLPLCIITIHKTVPMSEPVMTDVLTATESELFPATAIDDTGAFSWKPLIIAAYWAGVLFVIGSIVLGIIRVMKLIRRGEAKELYGTEVTVCEGEVPPFSWMKWIVMSKADFESGNHHILEHEEAHIRLGHSMEVLLFDVISALQWFNPAMWLLKRDLRAIHEYEADDAVLRGGADIKEYQYSLIRKAVSASGYSITNSFNHSILKNRITMMSKSKSKMIRGLKALYVIPLVAVVLACNSRTVTEYKDSNNPEQSNAIVFEIKKAAKEDSRAKDGYVICFEGLPVSVEEAAKLYAETPEAYVSISSESADTPLLDELSIALDKVRENLRPVVIELKEDSSGEYYCYLDGEKITYDDIEPNVREAIESKENRTVTIAAPAGVKYGVIDDILESLRKIDVLKVNYTCPNIAEWISQLSPDKEEAKQSEVNFNDSWDYVQSVPMENRHYVRINSADRILFDATRTDLTGLKELVGNAVRENPKSTIFSMMDRGTSYGMFLNVHSIISEAVALVRDEAASTKFGKSFEELSEPERNEIQNDIPLNVVELEAKNMAE